jgi:hypothetical protein
VRRVAGGLLMAVLACSDQGPPATASLGGSYSGSNGVYEEVTLTLTEAADALTGALLLRDASGTEGFDGPVAGARVGPSGFEVGGGRAPSVGGGTVSVQGVRSGSGMRVMLTSSWLPSTTITLTPQLAP